MDRIINVKVGGNYLTKDSKNAGVRGEANVTMLRITFDEGWDGYAKTVTFFDAQGNNPVKRIETVDLIEDITADARTYLTPIPQEPLAITGEMTFVIDGYLDGKRQRSIADKLVVKDAPETINATEPTDPTPSQAEQLQMQIDSIKKGIQDAIEAKEDIENMSVSAETVEAGAAAFVKKTIKDDVVNLHFGIPAGEKGGDGEDGVSPSVVVEETVGGYEVSISDAEGTKEFTITHGVDGVSPKIETEKTANGYTVSLTDIDGIKTFALTNGEDGVSPTLNVTKVTDGYEVSLTDAEGTKTFVLTNGDDGVSPSLGVTEVTNGYEVSLTDKDGTETFFIPRGGVVGEITADGGEIFNNYQNNKAYGKYSHASGYTCIAGVKGYYYSNIDFSGESPVIALTKEQGVEAAEAFEVGYAVGDVISITTGMQYLNCAKITAINNHLITVDSLPFTSFPVLDELEVDFLLLYVIDKPDVGEVSLGYYAHAEGEETIALERASHSEGRKTKALGQYAHAEGSDTIANSVAHAEGLVSQALGNYSHAEGWGTIAKGQASHSEGRYTNAIGMHSHAEGYQTVASADNAHAGGFKTTASGKYAHAEGNGTEASGVSSHSEGTNTTATSNNSHAEGFNTHATGAGAHTEGKNTQANNANAHAEGEGTYSEGVASHSEGINTQAVGDYSHAEGNGSKANGAGGHAEGTGTQANGNYSHAEGYGTVANGQYSHAEGTNTKAVGINAHAEGGATQALGDNAHAEGMGAHAVGNNSHASGHKTTALGTNSHIGGRSSNIASDVIDELSASTSNDDILTAWSTNKFSLAKGDSSFVTGTNCLALGDYSRAEGNGTKAIGINAYAEGNGTTANGDYSHAEGFQTTASSYGSHAEGRYAAALGEYSHAEGYGTIAAGKNQHVQGTYNEELGDDYLHIVGNGIADSKRSNAYTLDKNGNAWFAGEVSVGVNNDKLATVAELQKLITYGTQPLTAGESALETGKFYFQYE